MPPEHLAHGHRCQGRVSDRLARTILGGDLTTSRFDHQSWPIRLFDEPLLVVSPESMASGWVRTEIRKARKAKIREATEALPD